MDILHYPDPALLTRATPLTEIDRRVLRTLDEMREAMRDAKGVGLAAPQVGWSKRLFIVNREGTGIPDEVFINPVIVAQGGTIAEEEGCLSLPGLRAKVRRAGRVVVEAYNLEGEQVRIEAEGLLARVFQHERDHLDGRLFIANLSPAARLAIASQLRELEESVRKG